MQPRLIHISLGGPLRVMSMPSAKSITFEDTRNFGPEPCYPNGEPRKNRISSKSPFWPRYEAWVAAGKPVDAANRCIVTPTEADITEALRQLRQEMGGHEPLALAVYPRALEIAHKRAKGEGA